MKKHASAWIKGLVKYGIGFGLLAWVISRYWEDKYSLADCLSAWSRGIEPSPDTPGLHSLLNGPIEFGWLAAATVLMGVALSLQLFRWYLLVRAVDLPFSIRNAYRLGMVGLFYNTFLPGAVGGDLVKAYFLAKAHPERKTRAVATVAIDRAMGLFGLILFVAVVGGAAWALGDPHLNTKADLQLLVVVNAAIAGGSIASFLLLGLLPQHRVDRFAGRLKSVPKIGVSLAEIWYAVWMYRQRMRTVILGVVVTAFAHIALVSAFHCASRVFPPANAATEMATWTEHAVVTPLGFIIQAVPLSPGGVGVGEAAFAGLYKLTDQPETRGVIARLSLRIAEWVLALIGYIIFLRMKSHHELPAVEDADSGGANPPDPSLPPAG